jgi:hypothetical protein
MRRVFNNDVYIVSRGSGFSIKELPVFCAGSALKHFARLSDRDNELAALNGNRYAPLRPLVCSKWAMKRMIYHFTAMLGRSNLGMSSSEKYIVLSSSQRKPLSPLTMDDARCKSCPSLSVLQWKKGNNCYPETDRYSNVLCRRQMAKT